MTAQQHWILCGGLASGKSLVRRMLAESGVHTIDADAIGHEVLEPEGPAYRDVVAEWREVVVDGRIDRQKLARIVFGDPTELSRLESITHPHIFGIIKDRVEELAGPVVVEMPLLGADLGEDWRRMVVDSRDEVRLERAVSRGMDEADARARMERQPTRAQWLASADLVIPNHGGEDELKAVAQVFVPNLTD